jgi:hypothetical protein
MSRYPEHDKLHAIAADAQAQGELLDWLSEHGMQVMRWHETDETVTEVCPHCVYGGPTAEARCTCSTCHGIHQYQRTRHVEGWVRAGNIPDLLARYHGIDRNKLEAEKRAMLASLRATA